MSDVLACTQRCCAQLLCAQCTGDECRATSSQGSFTFNVHPAAPVPQAHYFSSLSVCKIEGRGRSLWSVRVVRVLTHGVDAMGGCGV